LPPVHDPAPPGALGNSGYKGIICRIPAIFSRIAAAMLPAQAGKLWNVAGDSLAR
jgi:hypothetical protein